MSNDGNSGGARLKFPDAMGQGILSDGVLLFQLTVPNCMPGAFIWPKTKAVACRHG